MGGETRRAKSLRNGVHHANAVVWGPVYRTHLRAPQDVRGMPARLEPSQRLHRLLPSEMPVAIHRAPPAAAPRAAVPRARVAVAPPPREVVEDLVLEVLDHAEARLDARDVGGRRVVDAPLGAAQALPAVLERAADEEGVGGVVETARRTRTSTRTSTRPRGGGLGRRIDRSRTDRSRRSRQSRNRTSPPVPRSAAARSSEAAGTRTRSRRTTARPARTAARAR